MIKCGWPVEFVGDVLEIGYTEKILTGVVKVTEANFKNVCETMGISGPVLAADYPLPMEKAA